MAIENLTVTGAGTITNLSNSGCTNNWECVDDPIGSPDDGSTYVHTEDDPFITDTYELSNVSVIQAGDTINHIIVHMRGIEQGGTFPTGNIRATIRSGTTNYNGATQALTTSWADYTEQWSTDPDTSVAWTISGLNALEAGQGLEKITGFGDVQISNTLIYVEVDYTVATGGIVILRRRIAEG